MNKIITLMLVLLCSVSMYSRGIFTNNYAYVSLADNDNVLFHKKYNTEIVISPNTIYVNTLGLEHVYRILYVKIVKSEKIGELIVYVLNEDCKLVLQAEYPFSILLALPDDVSYTFVNVE